MCEDLTPKSDKALGVLLRLCPNSPQCLVNRLDCREQGPSWKLFAAFQPRARTVVIENDYFDIDYRSEFSATHETSFSTGEPDVRRLHFFGRDLKARPATLYEFVRKASKTHCGYVIVRNQEPVTIGRSLVTLHVAIPGLRDLAPRIRTAVSERVELFGIDSMIHGVPFMEQDGHLLRCAHVAAWMAHYSAVLRGLVPRRVSAEFNRMSDLSQSYGRTYPSTGLTVAGIGHTLIRNGLPPEIFEWNDLVVKRPLSWYDRPALLEEAGGFEDEDEKAGAADGLLSKRIQMVWARENLGATVCRYLNSGFPSLLLQEDIGHAKLVCGYLREGDVDSGDPGSASGRVTHLIVNDDQVGPYSSVSIDDLAAAVVARGLSVAIPLPSGLWLSGAAAERGGAAIIEELVKRRYRQLTTWHARHDRNQSLTEHREAMERLFGNVGARSRHEVAIRSYATIGSDFKKNFAERTHDDQIGRVTGCTRMPRYIWVIEAISRELRKLGKPAVLATILLDGTTVSQASGFMPIPLLAQLPGQIASLTGPEALQNDSWGEVAIKPYQSGRWGHGGMSTDAEDLIGRFKSARGLS